MWKHCTDDVASGPPDLHYRFLSAVISQPTTAARDSFEKNTEQERPYSAI